MRRSLKIGTVLLIVIVLSVTAVSVQGQDGTRDEGNDIVNNSMTIEAVIDNNYATTTVVQNLTNNGGEAKEAVFNFSLPKNAFLSQFNLVLEGKKYYSEVVAKDLAEEEYEKAKESGKTASYLGTSGTDVTRFSYKINLKPGQTLEYELVYEEYIPRYRGLYTYCLPLEMNEIPEEGAFSIHIEMSAMAGFKDVTVDNYPDVHVEKGIGMAAIDWTPSGREFAYPMNVNYTLSEYPKNGLFLNCVLGDNGYFFHVFCPEVDDIGGKQLPKDIVFVLDKSGSMSGEKISQAKDAFQSIVADLQPDDMFNIVLFDDTISHYKSDLIEATESNIQSAKNYISDITADGGTNIDQALVQSLDYLHESENFPILCFLTDGQPTAGVTGLLEIRRNVIENNINNAAIFTLAFGNDCDLEFLKAIALENNGTTTKIDMGSDASDQIFNYYDTFSAPLVIDLKLNYGPGTWDVFPTEVRSLYAGSEIVVAGRYDTKEKSISATVSGLTSEGDTDFSEEFIVQTKPGNDFIARYWAFQKIKSLLDQEAVEANDTALQEEIQEIALDYQFVTPYTSMLLVIEDQEENPENPEETTTEQYYEEYDSNYYPSDDDDSDDDYYYHSGGVVNRKLIEYTIRHAVGLIVVLVILNLLHLVRVRRKT